MSAAAPTSVIEPLETPSLRRRLACFTYEGVLLFGVLVIADYLFASLTQQKHALQLREAGMAFLFVVLGIYFVWFWSHGGQTLAMKTWHIRVVTHDGRALSQGRAFLRYLAAWLWFLPPLAVVAGVGVRVLGGGGTFAVVLGYLLAYAAVSWVHPQRQFLHDVLCGTRLVNSQRRH
ncbi:MAG: RDD family protein [Betaproteobacteria bacterium]|nr:MAG: RDD family protein [Betaproteobacteria bacterium]